MSDGEGTAAAVELNNINKWTWKIPFEVNVERIHYEFCFCLFYFLTAYFSSLFSVPSLALDWDWDLGLFLLDLGLLAGGWVVAQQRVSLGFGIWSEMRATAVNRRGTSEYPE